MRHFNRQMQDRLFAFAYAYEGQLHRPYAHSKIASVPSNAVLKERPLLWQRRLKEKIAYHDDRITLGDDATLYHDCPYQEICMSQKRNIGSRFEAPYSLRLDIFEFAGSFLSVSIPIRFAPSLTQDQNILLRWGSASDAPIESFVKLTIEKGSQKEVQELTTEKSDQIHMAEFDLSTFHTALDQSQRAWFDISFHNMRANEITLQDLAIFALRKVNL